MDRSKLALFTLLGQSAQKTVESIDEVRPNFQLLLADDYDLSLYVPESLKRAMVASETYMLFFVFEEYLRELIVSVLTEKITASGLTGNWWDLIPQDVQDEINKIEETEDNKKWMALNPRGKVSLLTLPQLLKIIDVNWKESFSDVLMDKTLISQGRLLVHTRNTICHMSVITPEENNRVKQVMRDWFRAVAP